MGEAELNTITKTITIHSNIITYGNAANSEITEDIRCEIEDMWNEPKAMIYINNEKFTVQFHITASFQPNIEIIDVYSNVDPKNNYFRIEEFAHGNISFVDAIGCNSGYFKLENLYKGSTTAAHEYGHTLGLHHPSHLDLRGKGIPGIMYPRGTLVDAQYQYDPSKPAGVTGGTLHPMFRKVFAEDVMMIKLNRLKFNNGKSVIGEFTNVYHPDHKDVDQAFV